jgi:hypothetical protein
MLAAEMNQQPLHNTHAFHNRGMKFPFPGPTCPAENAAPSCVRVPKLHLSRDAAIKDLISKIELILPNVACASPDLSRLRRLFEEELADAAALRSNPVSSYL